MRSKPHSIGFPITQIHRWVLLGRMDLDFVLDELFLWNLEAYLGFLNELRQIIALKQWRVFAAATHDAAIQDEENVVKSWLASGESLPSPLTNDL